MLELRGVGKRYRGAEGPVRVLEGLSLRAEPGEVVAVRGPSGCGKTTLLLIAGGLLAPDEGSVRIAERDLYALGPEERARFRAETIGFVFQQFHLVPYLSVRDNILTPALACRTPNSASGAPPSNGASGAPPLDAAARAEELIARFQLQGRRGHVPSALSTGERQRTALARALLNQPRVLLADEPTGNLDGENAEIVLDALAAFAREGGTVLLVTHDPAAAERAHRQVVLARPGAPRERAHASERV